MSTSVAIDRASMRQLAAAMAFVMMIASLPSIGVIIISDRSGPSISIDICHPLQPLGISPCAVAVARPAQPEVGANLRSRETLAQSVSIAKSKFAEAPDPPPPKLLC